MSLQGEVRNDLRVGQGRPDGVHLDDVLGRLEDGAHGHWNEDHEVRGSRRPCTRSTFFDPSYHPAKSVLFYPC